MNLAEFVEIKNFGPNIQTFVAFAILVLTIMNGYGTLKQIRVIRHKMSGRSVSVPMYAFLGFEFLTFTLYGYYTGSLAMIVNGLLGLLYLRIVYFVAKYEGLTKADKAVIVLSAFLIPFIILVPGLQPKRLVMSVAFLLATLLMIDQPVKILRFKSAGSVDPANLIMFMTGCAFWFWYGCHVKDPMLMIGNPIAITILSATLVLWVIYRNKPAVETSQPLSS